MRLLWIFPLAAGALLAAGQAPFQLKPSSPVPVSATPRPAQVPAAAVADGPETYRYTDPAGKVWIFRNTPFGVMRFEDQGPKEPRPSPKTTGIRAKENGDTIEFEQGSPFGTRRWSRNKAELNDVERAAWEAQRAPGGEKQE